MKLENELKKEKLNRLAIGIAYQLLVPKIIKHHALKMVEMGLITAEEMMTNEQKMNMVSVMAFEDGLFNITQFIDEEFWNFVVDSVKGKLKKFSKDCPKDYKDLCESYINYRATSEEFA